MDQTKVGFQELNNLLLELNEKGGFSLSVITDEQGLPIASSPANDADSEKQSAVVSYIQNAASQVVRQLQMFRTDEISLSDENGQKLVCIPFIAENSEFILSVLIPDKKQRYKKVTHSAIREIRRIWKILRK